MRLAISPIVRTSPGLFATVVSVVGAERCPTANLSFSRRVAFANRPTAFSTIATWLRTIDPFGPRINRSVPSP